MKMPLLALVLCMPLLAFVATAEEEAIDQEAMMAAWMAAGTPGEVHACFAEKEGSWQVHSTMWTDPEAPPTESEATCDAKMVLGGRYLQEQFVGTAMGMPFDGLGMLGYDNTTGVVTALWWDSMSTMTGVLTGVYEKIGDPLELTGSMVDAYTKDEIRIRAVTTYVGKDEHRFEYYITMPGLPEMKNMEMVYTRAE